MSLSWHFYPLHKPGFLTFTLDYFWGQVSLVTAAMLLMLQTLGLVTTVISAGIDPAVAQGLQVLMWNFTLVFAAPMIAFTLGASLAIVRYSALPRWLGRFGFLVSLTLLMP